MHLPWKIRYLCLCKVRTVPNKTFVLHQPFSLSIFYTSLLTYMHDSFSLHPEKKESCSYNPKRRGKQVAYHPVAFKCDWSEFTKIYNNTKLLFLPKKGWLNVGCFFLSTQVLLSADKNESFFVDKLSKKRLSPHPTDRWWGLLASSQNWELDET